MRVPLQYSCIMQYYWIYIRSNVHEFENVSLSRSNLSPSALGAISTYKHTRKAYDSFKDWKHVK